MNTASPMTTTTARLDAAERKSVRRVAVVSDTTILSYIYIQHRIAIGKYYIHREINVNEKVREGKTKRVGSSVVLPTRG